MFSCIISLIFLLTIINSSKLKTSFLGGWGNSKSVIRKQKQGTPVAEHSHTPLDCDERKPFWIRWDENTIRVGAGRDVNAGEFMAYVDPTPTDVNYIAVSTGWGATGVWWFNLGNLYKTIKNSFSKYRT